MHRCCWRRYTFRRSALAISSRIFFFSVLISLSRSRWFLYLQAMTHNTHRNSTSLRLTHSSARFFSSSACAAAAAATRFFRLRGSSASSSSGMGVPERDGSSAASSSPPASPDASRRPTYENKLNGELSIEIDNNIEFNCEQKRVIKNNKIRKKDCSCGSAFCCTSFCILSRRFMVKLVTLDSLTYTENHC